MRTITVSTKYGLKSVNTELDLAQAETVLKNSTSEFAQKLRDLFWRNRMSAAQEKWLLVLAQESLDRENSKPAPAAQLGDLTEINKLFVQASNHLRYPKIVLALANGENVMLKPRKASGGGINVTNGEKYGSPNNVYYGRIEENGDFSSRNPDPDVVALLKRFAADPAGVAAEYGKLTGNCSFCSHKLTDERSTIVGYGPRCAEHYGLPWGHKHAPKLEVVSA